MNCVLVITIIIVNTFFIHSILIEILRKQLYSRERETVFFLFCFCFVLRLLSRQGDTSHMTNGKWHVTPWFHTKSDVACVTRLTRWHRRLARGLLLQLSVTWRNKVVDFNTLTILVRKITLIILPLKVFLLYWRDVSYKQLYFPAVIALKVKASLTGRVMLCCQLCVAESF